MEAASPIVERRRGDVLRNLGVSAAYFGGYVLLDAVSHLPGTDPLLHITPWNPPAALTVALLLIFGLRFLPLVFVVAVASGIIVRGLPFGLPVALASAAVIVLAYGPAAWLLKKSLNIDPYLGGLRDVFWLIGVVTQASLVVAAGQVGLLAMADSLHVDAFPRIIFHYWVREVIGILVLAPTLLVHAPALAGERRVRFPWGIALVHLATIVVVLAVVFAAADEFNSFYWLFLPLIWIGVWYGLPGATLGLLAIQVGVVVAGTLAGMGAADLIPEQLLMVTLAITGLVLGAVVSERRRAESWLAAHQAQLAHASRLSAAGEMAAALAHELNQPLAAVISYVRACRMLADSQGASEELRELMGKAVAQAERAGQVVRGLRAFLRKGEAERQPVQVKNLLAEAFALVGAEATRNGVSLRAEVDDRLPAVRVDVIQIEQVVVNLVRNSVEAMAHADSPRRQVVVTARLADADMVEVAVADTGPGLSPEIAGKLFTPFATDKPAGMGLGLAISRSIIQAHGGRLWADGATPSGCVFRFTLPAVEAND